MAGIQLGLIGSFPTPVTSSYESISTVALTNDSTSTINFNSIPSIYSSLQIRWNARIYDGFTTCQLNIRYNGDSGSNYTPHYLYGNGSSAIAGGFTTTSIRVFYMPGGSYAANIFGVGILDIHDYASTSKTKTTRIFSGYDTNGSALAPNPNQYVNISSGLWNSTAAVSSISIGNDSGTYASGTTFALYGIKGA